VSNFDFASVPESIIASGNKRTKLKKKRRTKQHGAFFLFLGSTDPVAKERLFLERFTCFQQGYARE
jgi:hypothetical protein